MMFRYFIGRIGNILTLFLDGAMNAESVGRNFNLGSLSDLEGDNGRIGGSFQSNGFGNGEAVLSRNGIDAAATGNQNGSLASNGNSSAAGGGSVNCSYHIQNVFISLLSSLNI